MEEGVHLDMVAGNTVNALVLDGTLWEVLTAL